MSSYVKKLNNNVKNLSCSYLNDIINEAKELKLLVECYTKVDTNNNVLWNVDTDTNNNITDWEFNGENIKTQISNKRYQIHRIIYKWHRNQKSSMNNEVQEIDTNLKNLHFSLHLYIIGMNLRATKMEFFNISDYVKSDNNISEFVKSSKNDFPNTSYFTDETTSPSNLINDINLFIDGINSVSNLLNSLGVDNIVEEENSTTTVEEENIEEENEDSEDCQPCKESDTTSALVSSGSICGYSNLKNLFPCDIVFVSSCHTNNFFNGTFEYPYKSLECAISNVPSKGTIVLFPGKYVISKTLEIPNKSITFSSLQNNFDDTIIQYSNEWDTQIKTLFKIDNSFSAC